jgi:hypothetical protein
MHIGKVHEGKKFSVNSCLPDFPMIKGPAFYGEIRKTGNYERKYNQTCTFPIGIWNCIVCDRGMVSPSAIGAFDLPFN